MRKALEMAFKGKSVFITGGSRGIGEAIAVRLARDGANVTIAAKTTTPHPKLPGTIYSAAENVEKAGGKALPVVCDIRDENNIAQCVQQAVDKFGGIDILINNASAIWPRPTLETPMKRYDLMHQINGRGTFAVSQACIPHLIESAKKGRNPHVLNISPPLNLDPKWFKPHTAYSMAKYNMSMCVLGMAEEFRDEGVAFNALWPRTGIATAAIEFIAGKATMATCRTPDIMADAAYIMLSRPSTFTGNFCVDDDVLESEGITDLEKYAITPGAELMPDFFVEPKPRL